MYRQVSEDHCKKHCDTLVAMPSPATEELDPLTMVQKSAGLRVVWRSPCRVMSSTG